jgi:hypothetical protein
MEAWQFKALPVATQHDAAPVVPHELPAQSFVHEPHRLFVVMSASQPSQGCPLQSR